MDTPPTTGATLIHPSLSYAYRAVSQYYYYKLFPRLLKSGTPFRVHPYTLSHLWEDAVFALCIFICIMVLHAAFRYSTQYLTPRVARTHDEGRDDSHGTVIVPRPRKQVGRIQQGDMQKICQRLDRMIASMEEWQRDRDQRADAHERMMQGLLRFIEKANARPTHCGSASGCSGNAGRLMADAGGCFPTAHWGQ